MTKTNETALTAQALGEALLAVVFETTIAKTKTFQLKLADFPVEAAVAFMQYGIGRKFNDAVGGSDKDAATKVELATAMIADWKAGKIGRQATAAVPNELKVQRQVVRELFNAAAPDAVKAAFKDKTADEQAAQLDAIFAKQSDERKAEIGLVVADRIKAAAAKAAQVKALTGDFAL